jgi:hypothetical protein
MPTKERMEKEEAPFQDLTQSGAHLGVMRCASLATTVLAAVVLTPTSKARQGGGKEVFFRRLSLNLRGPRGQRRHGLRLPHVRLPHVL